MKILLMCLLLTGCSPEIIRGIGQGFRGAGAAMSQDVYNAQNGRPPQKKEVYQPVQYESQQVDHQCRNECFNSGKSWAYCTKLCSY